MSKRYRTTDERVLQHILDHADISNEFVSRTRARYGLLSLSAPEFDEILQRHHIETHYHPDTKGQQYKIVDLAAALERLHAAYTRIQETPFLFERNPDDKNGGLQ